jgi:Fur family ferric uptake transcriptional regulator/Fur family zinc uptake transcriptional regulator
MLKGAGLRATSARQRVLSSLLEAGKSLSHRDLVDHLRELDRVTIFRSLKNLKKARLVHSVQGIDRTLRYSINPAVKRGCPGDHAHFLCLKCGAMSCLTDQHMPVVIVPKGSKVRGKQFLVYGTCTSCASSKRARTAPRSPPRDEIS